MVGFPTLGFPVKSLYGGLCGRSAQGTADDALRSGRQTCGGQWRFWYSVHICIYTYIYICTMAISTIVNLIHLILAFATIAVLLLMIIIFILTLVVLLMVSILITVLFIIV